MVKQYGRFIKLVLGKSAFTTQYKSWPHGLGFGNKMICRWEDQSTKLMYCLPLLFVLAISNSPCHLPNHVILDSKLWNQLAHIQWVKHWFVVDCNDYNVYNPMHLYHALADLRHRYRLPFQRVPVSVSGFSCTCSGVDDVYLTAWFHFLVAPDD